MVLFGSNVDYFGQKLTYFVCNLDVIRRNLVAILNKIGLNSMQFCGNLDKTETDG